MKKNKKIIISLILIFFLIVGGITIYILTVTDEYIMKVTKVKEDKIFATEQVNFNYTYPLGTKHKLKKQDGNDIYLSDLKLGDVIIDDVRGALKVVKMELDDQSVVVTYLWDLLYLIDLNNVIIKDENNKRIDKSSLKNNDSILVKVRRLKIHDDVGRMGASYDYLDNVKSIQIIKNNS